MTFFVYYTFFTLFVINISLNPLLPKTVVGLEMKVGRALMAFVFVEMAVVLHKCRTFQGHIGLCALPNNIQPNIY